MTLRITPQMVTSSTVRNVNNAFAALERRSNELSSGKSILEPSDNPYGTGKAIDLQSTIDGLADHKTSIDEAIGWEHTTSSALSSIGQVVQKARELTLQATSGVNGKSDLENLAIEVEQLTESAKQDTNVQYAGQYVLSGTSTGTAPYAAGAEDTYHGNEGTITRTIAPGMTIVVNQSANTLLGNGEASGDGKLLDTLRTIAKNMREGTPTALEALDGGDLKNLDANFETLLQMQAQAGGTVDQLQMAESRIEELTTSTTEALGNTQDANYAQVATEYTSDQVAYEAALKAGGSIVQMSLLEFLK
jgi:flagellar hook-associated protein 3 FlgL